MNGQEGVTCPAIVIAKLDKNKWRCHCECEIELFASEVERQVENSQFSDAACVFVGVYVFIVVPKMFRRIQRLELRVCRIFIPSSVGGRFFFHFFLGVW
jgi:hypothetical protein